MGAERAFFCSICFKPVDLTDCKIDENGRPIHETCFATKLLYKSNIAHKSSDRGTKSRGIVARLLRRAPR
jgi:hypothetical protein